MVIKFTLDNAIQSVTFTGTIESFLNFSLGLPRGHFCYLTGRQMHCQETEKDIVRTLTEHLDKVITAEK
jgi:hypothetical protein